MDFSEALKALKDGQRVERQGWNGKGMFLFYLNPYDNKQFIVTEKPEMVGTLMSYIAMKTADNKLIPWLASQTDLLAEDWYLVE